MALSAAVDKLVWETQALTDEAKRSARKGYVTPELRRQADGFATRLRNGDISLRYMTDKEREELFHLVVDDLREAIGELREVRQEQERQELEKQRRRAERAQLRQMLDYGDAVRDDYTADDVE